MFKAFVGGLYTDQGLEVVRSWLSALFRPYAEDAYNLVRAQHGLALSDTSSSSGSSSASPSPPSSPHPDSDGHDAISLPPPNGANAQANVNIGHLALFNQQVVKMAKQVEWVTLPVQYEQHQVPAIPSTSPVNSPDLWKITKSTPIWRIRVMIGGECYGEGKGMNKKAAKNEAAKHGLAKLGILTHWYVSFVDQLQILIDLLLECRSVRGT
ncbi:hypothetical protein VNI00_005759 [Paramarasmius palmivorus]|uniref:DRBM domain-containing protein n=1 Tax=Paramarasmius palmivorus TaxID=297713 RepID=A0AAW0DDU0_9AGAR